MTLLNTFHSISHATLFWWWIERRSNKNYSAYYERATKYESLLLTYYKGLLRYHSVLQKYYSSTTKYHSSTTRALLRTTKYYSSTTKYYPTTTNYHSSTTPKCYTVLLQSTTPYYKVLLQYYKVLTSTTKCTPALVLLQSTSLVLLTLEYKVLRSISTVPIMQSTTPVLQSTDSSTTLFYKVLTPCTTKILLQYYKVLLQYYSRTTPVLQSFAPVPKCYEVPLEYRQVLQ